MENVTFHLFDRREERLDERDAVKTTTTWIETTAIPMLILLLLLLLLLLSIRSLSLVLCVCAHNIHIR